MYQCKLKKCLCTKKVGKMFQACSLLSDLKLIQCHQGKQRMHYFTIGYTYKRTSQVIAGWGNIIIPKFTDHILISSFLDNILVGCEFMNEKAMNLQKFLHKFEQCIRSQRINSMGVTAINLIHLN